eukprot:CAMPEP_0181296254 /NCGR_PEP_ID=MMETSP1101-20121128/4601_1 /TAXON_ID=46948 /ORGANISM="Rhodomonas abbreviata, Strain Caron Lab Isolate" /LENGTH=507 /DNA_ID=CAMNT_0023401097 /DNA_START=653 /DNA_END=2176 /DNA_ORIENTATION=+
MTRMVDPLQRTLQTEDPAKYASAAVMMNARRRRISNLSRSAYFRAELPERHGEEHKEASFCAYWSKTDSYLLLKALRSTPPRPPAKRRGSGRPPGLHAVPEAAPGVAVVAGAVMTGDQSKDLVKDEEAPEFFAECRLEVLCLLDLDMTCFWGNDANDLGCAMQWMGKPKPLLHELYSILWNPNAEVAMREMGKAHDTRVVIYTMRPALLRYNSPFRRECLALRWNPAWHYDQVTIVDNEAVPQQLLCIPSSVRSSADILETYSGVEELMDRERTDLGLCFERLLAARDVVQEKLGLDVPPIVMVTCTIKDVVFAARCVGHVGARARAFLWDDNEKLWNRRNVLAVDKFDELPPPAYNVLQRFLAQQLPVEELDEGLVRFLQGAPEVSRVLEESWGPPPDPPQVPGLDQVHLPGPDSASESGGVRARSRRQPEQQQVLGLRYCIKTAAHVPPTWPLPSLPGLQDARYGLLSLRTWSKTLMRMGSEVDVMIRRVYSSSSLARTHDAALT